METPLELIFTNMDASPAVEARVNEKVAHLEKTFGRITSCHVFIDAPHHHKRKGNHYDIRLELRVPGADLGVSNEPGKPGAHEDIYVAIRDAFEALERQLEKYKQQKRGDVKTHEPMLTGRVAEIDYERGFGQILAADGRYVYFHRNAVIDGPFHLLTVDAPVELGIDEEGSEQGPHASSVRAISKLAIAGGRG